MSPERIIAEVLAMAEFVCRGPREDAHAVMIALAQHGYRITDEPRATLPAITRTYAEPLGWTTSSAGGLW